MQALQRICHLSFADKWTHVCVPIVPIGVEFSIWIECNQMDFYFGYHIGIQICLWSTYLCTEHAMLVVKLETGKARYTMQYNSLNCKALTAFYILFYWYSRQHLWPQSARARRATKYCYRILQKQIGADEDWTDEEKERHRREEKCKRKAKIDRC